MHEKIALLILLLGAFVASPVRTQPPSTCVVMNIVAPGVFDYTQNRYANHNRH